MLNGAIVADMHKIAWWHSLEKLSVGISIENRVSMSVVGFDDGNITTNFTF